MKKIAILTLAAAAFAGAAVAEDKLAVKGSDTLGAKMMPRLADSYKNAGNAVTFEIEDKGSSSAFTSLEGGTADIGMSSRNVKDEEKEKFAAKGQELVEFVAATDMIAVIVNEKCPLDSLTLKQVEGIFTGDITDWSEIGGAPGKISAYTRNEQSGTYASFQELAMAKRDYGSNTQKMEGNEPIANEVAGDANGIGYVGKAYADKEGVKALSIDGVAFSTDNKETYPIGRKLFWYTVGQPEGAAKKFLDWATTSAEAAKVIDEVGFIPNEAK